MWSHFYKTVLCCCFLFSGFFASAGDPGPSRDLAISFPVIKYKLANGLTVLLQEDHTVPMVSYHTWYRVGSRDEQPGVTGAAHMLEHMMFKGAKKYSGHEFDRILHQNGITNNAFTTWDYTGFYENLPSTKLELMMDIEVDRMRFLALRAEDLKSELEVVKEERRWRVDNNPSGLLRENLFDLAYQKHNYRWPVIGTMADITQYTPEKLRVFYDKYYVPNNAVLVLAGDIDLPKTKALIEKYYGPLKASPLAPRAYTQEPPQTKARQKVVKSDVQSSTLMLAYPGVATDTADSYALDLLASVLGNGTSNPLYRKFVFENQTATSAGAYNLTNTDPGLLISSVSLKPGEKIVPAGKVLRAELWKLRTETFTPQQLEKAKNQLMKEFLEGLTTIDGKAQSLAVNEITTGSYENLFADLQKYEAVTTADLTRVAKKYIVPEHEDLVILEPKVATRSATGKTPAHQESEQ